jgi:hypothetical protein
MLSSALLWMIEQFQLLLLPKLDRDARRVSSRRTCQPGSIITGAIVLRLGLRTCDPEVPGSTCGHSACPMPNKSLIPPEQMNWYTSLGWGLTVISTADVTVDGWRLPGLPRRHFEVPRLLAHLHGACDQSASLWPCTWQIQYISK